MASADGFFELPTRVRKDPLGPGYLNGLEINAQFLTDLFQAEHLLTNANGAYGEHNAREIARASAQVVYSAGYTLGGSEAYLSLAGGHNPAVGTLILTVTAGKLTSGKVAVQAQNMSESGLVKPALTIANVTSATTVTFYNSYLSSALGAGNAWTAEDANFHAALHSEPQLNPLFSSTLTAALKGRGLRAAAVWDELIQRTGDLYYVHDQFHVPSSGEHDDMRIAKAIAHIEYSGGAYRAVSSSHNEGIGSITTVGTGICRVALSPSLTAPVSPFVMVDYARNNSGSAADFYVACTPLSVQSTTQVEVYLYKYDTATDTWARADTDFWVVVHDGA